MIAVAFALALSGSAVAQDPEDYGVEIEPLVVVGRITDPLLTVHVDGDLSVGSLVRSDPIGVRCGGHAYRYAQYGKPRLCWLRISRGAEIVLSASGPGRVTWTGCEPYDDGRHCRLRMGEVADVRAVYSLGG